MKNLFLLCLFVLTFKAMAGDVRLVHDTCKLAVHPTYTNDGLNQIVTQAADDYLTKKGFKVISMEEAEQENDNVMAIKVDLKTTVADGKGRCRAIMSVRPTLHELDSDMLLATIIDKKGSYKTVSNKCIKDIIKNIKKYPGCSTVLDPEAQQDTPDEDDQTGDDQSGDIADDQEEDSGDTAGEKIRRVFARIFKK
ncbi:MAG: hypothetical protein CME70_17290 [Halobacteriovorax sp.]|nr:hypothetical protein [Halobacteriovorax sp.]